MQADTSTKKLGVLVRYRTWFIIGGIVLFLPPLSFLFQFTQDANFCGSWCPRMFFAWRKGMEASQFFLGFLRSYMGVILVAGVLLSTLFFGRYWCSHLCPVGGTMEAGSRFFPKFMKINFTRIPAPSFRYGYLFVYLLAPAIGLGSLCCNYCNFAAIPRIYGAAVGGADLAYFLRTAGLINLGLIVVLGFFARGGRAYCNLLCPIGALDSLMNRFGGRWGRRVLVAADKCNGCGACKKVCPTWAIEMKDKTAIIDQLSCMPCRLCEQSCKTEAIVYGKSSS